MKNAALTADDWRFDPESGGIRAPGSWSDSEGEYFDYRYPRVIADLPDDWDQTKHGRMIAAAPKMLAALDLALEYWAHRQQRYRNRHPVWVQAARAAVAKAKLGEEISDG